jgi:hypothetical protein
VVSRRRRNVVIAAAFAFAVAALIYFGFLFLISNASPWSDDPGKGLAARLRAVHPPLIETVEFQSHTMIDPPEVHIIVRNGVSEAQAEQLWCEVVAPAGGTPFEGNLGALIYDQEGNWLASTAAC